MDSEYYEKDGRKYDRITKILGYLKGDELVNYLIKHGKRENTAALRIGSKVDGLITEWWQKGMKERPTSKQFEVSSCLKAFFDWYDNNKVDIVDMQVTLYNDALGFAGTFDMFANVNDVATMIDLKTSKKIVPEYFIQVGTYAYEYRKVHESKKLMILRLDKNLEMYEDVSVDYDTEYFSAFHGRYCNFKLAERLKGENICA